MNRQLCTYAAICILLVLFGAAICRNSDDATPRKIVVRTSDLSDIRTISGVLKNGTPVLLEVADYIGRDHGFWGSETTPPRSVVRRIGVQVGASMIDIPVKYCRDLSNVVMSPKIKTISDLLAIDHNFITLNTFGKSFVLTLRGGDGVESYHAQFDLTIHNESQFAVEHRKISYIQD